MTSECLFHLDDYMEDMRIPIQLRDRGISLINKPAEERKFVLPVGEIRVGYCPAKAGSGEPHRRVEHLDHCSLPEAQIAHAGLTPYMRKWGKCTYGK